MQHPTYKLKTFLGIAFLLFFVQLSYGQDVLQTINKNYQLQKSSLVKISNKYGDVVVTPWEKDQLDIKVEILVKARTEKRAMAMYDRIHIDIHESNPASLVSFQTEIDNLSSRNNETFEINYYLRIPDWATLDLSNKYGKTLIGTLKGKTKLDLAYQDLIKIERLLGDSRLKFRYSDNIKIKEISHAEVLNISYSEMELDQAGYLDLTMKYSEVEIDQVDKIDLSAGYGELKIQRINIIKGKFSYTELDIDELATSLELSGAYGGDFEVDRILSSVKKIDLSVKYTDIELKIDRGLNADFEATTSYGDISLNKQLVKCHYINKENRKKEYRGKIGTGQTAKIKIVNSYSDVEVESSED